jgi:hypothetical protein
MVELVIYKEERQSLGEVAFISDTPNQLKIRDITDDEVFIHQLVKSIVLINALAGIKEPISDIVKADIKEMILSRFKTFSFDELSYAFKLERYGKLEPRTEHFQLFDAVYVSKVLEKYKKWKLNKRISHNISKSKESNRMNEEELQDRYDVLIDEVKRTKHIQSPCVEVYDWLDSKLTFNFSREFKIEMFRRAKASLLAEEQSKDVEWDSTIFTEIKKGNIFVVNKAKKFCLENYIRNQNTTN